MGPETQHAHTKNAKTIDSKTCGNARGSDTGARCTTQSPSAHISAPGAPIEGLLCPAHCTAARPYAHATASASASIHISTRSNTTSKQHLGPTRGHPRPHPAAAAGAAAAALLLPCCTPWCLAPGSLAQALPLAQGTTPPHTHHSVVCRSPRAHRGRELSPPNSPPPSFALLSSACFSSCNCLGKGRPRQDTHQQAPPYTP